MRILKVFLVVAPCITVLAFHGGWFAPPTYGSDAEYDELDVNLTAGPDKGRNDAEAVGETTTDLTDQVTDGVEDFSDRAMNKVKSDDE